MRTYQSLRTVVAAALGFCGGAAPFRLGAQSAHVADSLLAVGSLARAESVYYAAVRVRPRDPVARWALGRFLVERGATRVGATLLEESLQFGGDPVLVGRELVRAYLQTREFAPLAGLAAASPAQRERARWLAAHEPRMVSADSVVAAPFLRSEDTSSLANIPIRVNGVALVVSVSPFARGLVVSRTAIGTRRLREFAAGADTSGDAEVLAVADSVSIGRLTMLNQPVTVARLPARTQGLIGLAELGRFAPTVSPKSGRITLRVDGSLHDESEGERLATLDLASGICIVRAGGWMTSQTDLARLLRNREWTFDAKRGTLIVER